MSESPNPGSPIPAHSPIAAVDPTERQGWVVTARRSGADLVISDETPLAKIAVRGPVEGATRRSLGAPFGRAARTAIGGVPALAVGAGPGEWLVLGAPDARARLLAAVTDAVGGSGEFVSVVDLTHGRAVVRLTGRHAAAALATVCGIDLGEASTPNGAALRTSVASVVTDVVRDDVAGTPSYLLGCERSVGQFLADALRDAGREHGIDTTAFTGLGTP